MQSDDRRLRVVFETQGCRSNYADTVHIQAGVTERGGIPAQLDDDADVIVVNTCSVTDSADRDALKLIAKVRKSAPNARVVVTGCFAEVGQEQLLATGQVDAVLGPGRRAELLDAIFNSAPQVAKRPDTIPLADPFPSQMQGPGALQGELPTRARFHLRIQEGCENFCTFCIIPKTRGGLSTRPIEAVLDDIRSLESLGYQEVVLSGTHIGGYGEDCGLSLLRLLEAIAASPGPRIRISSIDPNDLSKDIIDLLAASDRFCRHLHICVQAFTDRTLKRMNRKYRMRDAEEILWYAHRSLPGVCIGSDVIVGFPGESRQEVDQGVEAFLRLPISYLHVFPYSERSGTAATRLDGAIDIAERRRRAARWRAIAERRRTEYLSGLLGRELEIIIERLEANRAYGTSSEFAEVCIEGTAVPLRIGAKVNRVAQSLQAEVLICQ